MVDDDAVRGQRAWARRTRQLVGAPGVGGTVVAVVAGGVGDGMAGESLRASP